MGVIHQGGNWPPARGCRCLALSHVYGLAIPWFMPDACVDHYLSLASLKSRFEAMGWCHAVCSSGTP